MKISEVIKYLKRFPDDMHLERSFGHFHSYRGDYHSLGAEQTRQPITVREQIKAFDAAAQAAFAGYKGGEYQMSQDSDVYLAVIGCEGVELKQHHIAGWLFVIPFAQKQRPTQKIMFRKTSPSVSDALETQTPVTYPARKTGFEESESQQVTVMTDTRCEPGDLIQANINDLKCQLRFFYEVCTDDIQFSKVIATTRDCSTDIDYSRVTHLQRTDRFIASGE